MLRMVFIKVENVRTHINFFPSPEIGNFRNAPGTTTPGKTSSYVQKNITTCKPQLSFQNRLQV